MFRHEGTTVVHSWRTCTWARASLAHPLRSSACFCFHRDQDCRSRVQIFESCKSSRVMYSGLAVDLARFISGMCNIFNEDDRYDVHVYRSC